ncbi:GntR family transcriptional regulator [Ruminococcaceae bacterium OttesenSCG-928-L11]|nr:GntR family transcriptional regulator [Ruminococcaceae bacterium OttesenSCG-928-L11]
MIKLDLQSRLPIYEQLKARISELVLTGVLKPDDQLPSVRTFARELGINPNTVQKAYQELERDNIVYSVAGRGSYISSNSDLTDQLQEQQLDAIRQTVRQAKNASVPKDKVLHVVEGIYDETPK